MKLRPSTLCACGIITLLGLSGCGSDSGGECDDLLSLVNNCAGDTNNAPIVNAGADLTVALSQLVDGEIKLQVKADDPDGDTLSYAWSIASTPTASSLDTLNDTTSATISFVADVVGSYSFEVTADDGDLSTTDSITVTVTDSNTSAAERAAAPHTYQPQTVHWLDHKVVDANYSHTLDQAVWISDTARLYRYSLDTQQLQTIELPQKALHVALSRDGLYAAITHESAISYVDLDKAQLVQVLPQATAATPAFFDDSHLTQQARFAQHLQNSPTWQPQVGCEDFWLSADQQRIFTACGTVFDKVTSTDQDVIVNYAGALGSSAHIVALADSAKTHKIAAIAHTAYPHSAYPLALYDSRYLSLETQLKLPELIRQQQTYPSTGQAVFFSQQAAQLIVILKSQPSLNNEEKPVYGLAILGQATGLNEP